MMRSKLKPPPGACKARLPDFVSPQLATLVKEPPSGDEWLHELKFDGYRMLCRVDRGRVTVWSRNGKDWTEKFQNVVEAVKSLKATSAMLDGEIVIVDAEGRSSFQKLQRAMGKTVTSGFAYEVFDLIYLDGLSLTQTPLKHRKELLRNWWARIRTASFAIANTSTKAETSSSNTPASTASKESFQSSLTHTTNQRGIETG